MASRLKKFSGLRYAARPVVGWERYYFYLGAYKDYDVYGYALPGNSTYVVRNTWRHWSSYECGLTEFLDRLEKEKGKELRDAVETLITLFAPEENDGNPR